MHNKKRLEKQLLYLISDIISEEIENEKLQTITSVVEVSLNKDNSQATIYVDFYKEQEKLLKELNKASGFIKSILASRLSMRKVPNLIFSLDKKLDKQNEIERILEKG